MEWKRLIKESYRILNEDTDELDDADLPIGVNPKEYHKQKSKMRSLPERIASITKEVNNETKRTIDKNILELSKKLNKWNRENYSDDNMGDDWLRYKGEVNLKVLKEAFNDGMERGFNDFEGYEELVNEFNKVWLKKAKNLINGGTLKVYRGVALSSNAEEFLPALKYNMQERNSWSFDKDVALNYMDYESLKNSKEDMIFMLEMTCSLNDTNLVFSAWAEGYWCGAENHEINLKKNLLIKSIKVTPMNEIAKLKYKNM